LRQLRQLRKRLNHLCRLLYCQLHRHRLRE
jgi:hypothetical protein